MSKGSYVRILMRKVYVIVKYFAIYSTEGQSVSPSSFFAMK
ncbi:hypothetical protein [Ammoniphilus sp. CFH 90114]|nr:hypothetical protein [Ammoniphilus sp. CFH 90114]